MKRGKFGFLLLIMGVILFVFSGCDSSIPIPESTPIPSTPTPLPTPLLDQACPKVLSTVVKGVYDADHPGAFAIIVTFDEPVENSCIEYPKNWDIRIRVSSSRELTTQNGDIQVSKVTVDAKKVTVNAYTAGGSVPNGLYVWSLQDCPISDASGNSCCGYSGCTCYKKPTCESCFEVCPL